MFYDEEVFIDVYIWQRGTYTVHSAHRCYVYIETSVVSDVGDGAKFP